MKKLKKGDKVKYEREIMFKGTEKVTATVVAVNGSKAILDNGDEIFAIR